MYKIGDRIGFIGGGNIAFAMGSILIAKGDVKANQVYVSGPRLENLERWRKIGAHITKRNGVVVTKCDIIFICVKSNLLYKCSQQIESEIEPSVCESDKIFVSVVTGVNVDQLELAFSFMKLLKIIRAIPNISVQSGEGITTYVPGRYVKVEDLKKLKLILSSFGIAEQVQESMMDAISALTSSGTALVFTVINAMTDGGVQQGIPLAIALRFAAQTTIGAAKTVLTTGKHPAVLRDEECSPGGSTIVGFHELEKSGIRNGFINAVEIATKLNKALGFRGLSEEFDCSSIKIKKN